MKMYLNTVSDTLLQALQTMMASEVFDKFRLVGGTALSLQLGHRKSVDIDLFADAEYGTIDFERIKTFLADNFKIVQSGGANIPISLGQSFFVGDTLEDLVKLDLFYTDLFVFPILEAQGLRLATVEEIVAMKLEVVTNGGRKKDFWDIHALLDLYSLEQMFDFYKKRYPYGVSKEVLKTRLTDFSVADDDFSPICMHGKVWELIKLDFLKL